MSRQTSANYFLMLIVNITFICNSEKLTGQTVNVGGGYVFQEWELEPTPTANRIYERCSQNSFSSKSMSLKSEEATKFCANECKTIKACRYFMMKDNGKSCHPRVGCVDRPLQNCYFYSECTISKTSSQLFKLWELRPFNFNQIHRRGTKPSQKCKTKAFKSKSNYDCKTYCSQYHDCKFFMSQPNKCWLYKECLPTTYTETGRGYDIYEKVIPSSNAAVDIARSMEEDYNESDELTIMQVISQFKVGILFALIMASLVINVVICYKCVCYDNTKNKIPLYDRVEVVHNVNCVGEEE